DQIVANLGPGGNADVLVDDGPPDPAVPPDIDALEQYRRLHVRKRVDAHTRREHRAIDAPPRDDAAFRDQRVGGDAHAGRRLLGEHELRRRQRVHPGADGPARIVKVEGGYHLYEIHIRLPVRERGPHVAPVAALALVAAWDLVGGE